MAKIQWSSTTIQKTTYSPLTSPNTSNERFLLNLALSVTASRAASSLNAMYSIHKKTVFKLIQFKKCLHYFKINLLWLTLYQSSIVKCCVSIGFSVGLYWCSSHLRKECSAWTLHKLKKVKIFLKITVTDTYLEMLASLFIQLKYYYIFLVKWQYTSIIWIFLIIDDFIHGLIIKLTYWL